MRLIVQSDDYGITRAQALGALEGIKNGIVRNTGIFTNMPWFDEIAEWIRPYIGKIDLGIDLNCSTGWPVLDPSEIPSLCQENGKYKTSAMNRALDTPENNYDHFNYEEIMKEYDAQMQKYIAKFDRLPDYIQGHVYITPTLEKAQQDIAAKYGVPYCQDIIKKLVSEGRAAACPSDDNTWYVSRDLDKQATAFLKDYLLQDRGHLLGKEVGIVTCHCGYVDRELMDFSTFNIYRLNDLDACTSKEIKDWVKENNIELARYSEYK